MGRCHSTCRSSRHLAHFPPRIDWRSSVDDRRQTTSDVAGKARGDQTSMIGSLPVAGSRGQQRGQGGSDSGDAYQPEDFVWPGRSRGAGRDGERSGNQVAAADSGSLQAPASPGAHDALAGAGGTDLLPTDPGTVISGNKSNAEDIGTESRNGGLLAGGPGSGFMPAGSGTGSGNSEDIGTGAIAGQLPASASGGLDSALNPGGSNAGLIGRKGNAEDTGGGNRPGGFVTAAPTGRGLGDQPGALGSGPRSGNIASSGNAKAGGDNDPASQPFPARAPGIGGTGALAGRPMPGGGARGADGVVPLPNLEPASDPPAGSRAPGQNDRVPGAGAGDGRDAQTGRPSARSNSDETETTTGGAPGQTGNGSSSAADPTASGSGSGTQSLGFDWDAAAKGRLPAGGAGGTGVDPALGVQEMDDQAPAQPRAASSANVAPGRAIAQASDSATAQPGLQGGAIPPGQFSQDDANRASSTRRTELARQPGAGAAACRSIFRQLVAIGNALERSPEQLQFEQPTRRYAAGGQHAVEHVVFVELVAGAVYPAQLEREL